MSEPKLISPMLDNFVMGAPISNHNGVRCCPAMAKDSDEKYIVKIISIPASQVQLDALLLTGAYRDRDAALLYFKELSDGVVSEAQILQRLSLLEGFIPYESWQVVPMDDGTGFDVYLLSRYKRSLERFCRRNTITHLAAVNLGLDLCAALAVCRRAGYLYVDLKPDNIFLTDTQQFRIGDLGFLSLSSLKYASLPEKYRSAYTAPEITDAFSALNTTIDIYAAGLVLYQVFNGNTLPFDGDTPPSEPLPAPLYADYEMAEIIAKACAPDPKQRWQDPIEMGQALVSYMQRNGANDTPIVPPPVQLEERPIPEEPEISEDPSPSEIEEDPEPEADFLDEAPSEAAPAEDNMFSAEEPLTPVYMEDDLGNLSFLLSDDETVPDLEDAEVPYDEVTEEVSDMLAQVDDLLSHPTPDPVVPPAPIDVPIPPPIRETVEEPPEEAEAEQASADAQSSEDASEEGTAEEATAGEPDTEEDLEEEAPETEKKSSGVLSKILTVLLVVLLLLAAAAGGVYYYQTYYLQPISAIILDGSETSLTVALDTDIRDDLLTVVCEDTYGNQKYASVTGGQATFTDLAAGMVYTVRVDISGFHRLTGQTTGSYTTPALTNIVQMNAITGLESGSVIVSFTAEGPESEQWRLLCSAPGETDRSATFTGHTVTVTGLTVGKEYTLRLSPVSELYLTGVLEIPFTASELIYAQNLAITDCSGGILKACWSAPEDAVVDTWTVRCYNDRDYDELVTVVEPNVTFEGIDGTMAYTLEVTAANMSVSERATITSNPLTVTDFQTESAGASQLLLHWESSDTPQEGWELVYTTNSGLYERLNCAENTAVINPVLPGTTYTFTLRAADGTTVLGGLYTYIAPEAPAFKGYGVTAPYMLFSMCRTPNLENWTRNDLKISDYTTTFAPGERMSFVVRLRQEYSTSSDTIVTLYVIQDESGMPVSYSTESRTWTSMWYRGYGTFNVPPLPTTPGNYTISVYLNDQLAATHAFTIE